MRARSFSSVTRLSPFFVFGAIAVAMPAFAQSSGGSTPAPQLTVYPACGTSPPSKDDSEVAHGAYIAGKRAFDENDYPTAIQYFKDALRRDCTKYELLNIISRAFELKGDRPEAINALETYVKRAPANDPSVEPIQRRIANLKALQAAADASAKNSSSPAASTAAASTATASPTSSSITEPPPVAPTRQHTVAPWIVVGAGVVAVGVGIPLAIIGSGGVSDANDKITALGCDPDSNHCKDPKNVTQAQNIANGTRQTSVAEQDIGLVLVGVGGAAIVGGLIWHFIEPTGPDTSGKSGKIDVRPDARPGYGGLTVVGSF